ncbi:MAG: TIGR00730 family Rossman fold protein [Bacteroidota bacterium]
MRKINSLLVFCGSKEGVNPQYKEQAFLFGQYLAEQQIKVVYGGAMIGVMGAVADGVLSKGGEITGVIPKFLSVKEIIHENLTTTHVVNSMHERKLMMSEMCDAIVALPGGYGTLDELFEILTWAQLGLHQKPVGILNTEGYYDGLITFINSMRENGFVAPVHQHILQMESDFHKLMNKLNHYISPPIPQWLHRDEV